jgi:hypothetical protein
MPKQKRPARGPLRYVIVTDPRTGKEHRVLTSIAVAGYALMEHIPSNEHRKGALGGMLITHGAITKAAVFNDKAEADVYIARGNKMLDQQRVPLEERGTYWEGVAREIETEPSE